MSHYHVWTRSVDGVEFTNCTFEEVEKNDAIYHFTKIANGIYHPEEPLTPAYVSSTLDTGNGMWAGGPGLMLVLSRCIDNCNKATWN